MILQKPIPKTQEPAYDWNECVDYIEKKYDIDIRNYAGWKPGTGDEKPYQDFWHWFSERYDVQQGGYTTACFGQDIEEATMEDWQKEIAKLFVDEFGEEEIRFWIDW